jgi:hypothetical protein
MSKLISRQVHGSELNIAIITLLRGYQNGAEVLVFHDALGADLAGCDAFGIKSGGRALILIPATLQVGWLGIGVLMYAENTLPTCSSRVGRQPVSDRLWPLSRAGTWGIVDKDIFS